jgi:surface polysaccharide O-acyltransferase-like enzyme
MDRKNGIDLFRLIGAFFVMCLHSNYGSLNQEYIDTIRLLSRWAVPFFFISSGFFLSNKIENGNLDFKGIQKNVSTLISILIVSSIIYLPIDVLQGDIPNSIATILAGSFFHLWFIGALLVGYIFIWYLFYIKKSEALPFISICIVLVALAADSYDQLFNRSIDFSLPLFLLSIPFMHIGIILSKKENNLVSNKLLIGLVLIGLTIQFIEAELFLRLFDYKKNSHQFLVGTIVVAISLFVFSSQITLQDNRFSKWGREYSLFIYLYHPLISMIAMAILKKLIPSHYESIRIVSPLIGFGLSLAFSITLNTFLPKIYTILNGDLQKKPLAIE